MLLPYVYRVTKYNPADRDERGYCAGTESSMSDHGPVEAAYLRAVAAFAEETGVGRLEIREPEVVSFINVGLEAPVDGYGLAGLFPPDLSGYRDGAQVTVAVGLELVRAMLRDNGAWCRLEVEGRFFVHVGYDQYLFVGSSDPCERAQALTRTLGLFPERIDTSPYEPELEPGEQRAADEDFWAAVSLNIPRDGALLLEEGYIGNASRWHRLTRADIEPVRARLTPRARLTVWPDLSTDLDAVAAAFPEDGLIELIWQDPAGQISSRIGDEEPYAELTALLDHARAAAVLPMTVDERHPLLTAVLLDSDGTLRARWRTEPAQSDLRWSLLKAFHRGQIRTGTVTSIRNFGVFVDMGGIDGMVNVAELSWGHVGHPSQIVEVGQQVTVEVLDVDLARERMSLSLKALQDDPWPEFNRTHHSGQIISGRVTKLVPFGAFVRVTDTIEGLIHNTDLADRPIETPEQVVQVGEEIRAKILEIDLDRRRVSLSHKQADDENQEAGTPAE
ncbi:MAG: hypothetical protein JWL97_3702 [Gemmatimonadales bacterium]|nr:hypothetical protein [Gemmatimonadales bacterium]